MMHLPLRAWILSLPIAATPAVAVAGIYDEPKSLKVLPADISPNELRLTMRGFALDLGIGCESCHVGQEGQPLETYDFASDDKEMKATARLMLRMMADINDRHLEGLDRSDQERVKVRCVTCHRGLARPLLINDVLELAYGKGGAAAAIARYRELKAESFGSGSYDFTEQARLEFARVLAARNDIRGAAEFLGGLRAEHGAGFMTDLTLAELYLAEGDCKRAIDSLEAARTGAPPDVIDMIGRRFQGLDCTPRRKPD